MADIENTEVTKIESNDGKPEYQPIVDVEVIETPDDPNYVADQDPNKLFVKEINGSRVTKRRNQITVIIDDFQFINPNDTILFKDGWEEFVIPPPIDPVETVDSARSKMIRKINLYDSSSSVNKFTVSGSPIWLDKATRVGLRLRFESEIAMGITNTALWYEGVKFELETEKAIKMLFAIELYASACYDNTQRHLATVNKLESVEECESYDYKSGYPEILTF